MKRAMAVVAVMAFMVWVMMVAGCKKRYIPRVSEEIIDQGVPIQQETVVE